MNAITSALLSALLATSMGTLLLHKHGYALWKRSRLFKLRELQDRLQVLAIDRKIDLSSGAYKFLQFAIDLCIRHADITKLNELHKIFWEIETEMNAMPSRDVFSAFLHEKAEVHELAADVFYEVGRMFAIQDNDKRWLHIVANLSQSANESIKYQKKYQLLSTEIRNAAVV